MSELDGLAGFASWLRERRLVRENRVPYFLKWVQRFLGFAQARPGESWNDTLRVFLEDLEAGGLLDWQVRQAGDAVGLYCGQYLGASGGRPIVQGILPSGRNHHQPMSLLPVALLQPIRKRWWVKFSRCFASATIRIGPCAVTRAGPGGICGM